MKHGGLKASGFAALAAVLSLAGCLPDLMDPDEQESELDGAFLATFKVEEETFRVWVTNQNTMHELTLLATGDTDETIPIGALLPGPGLEDHNLPWSWHLDPAQTILADTADVACNDIPSAVEDDLSNWLDQGWYCPWSAELIGLEHKAAR